MNNSRFTHLMNLLLDDTLSHEEFAELTHLLRENPELLGLVQEHLEVADWIAQAEDELRDSSRFIAATLARTGEDPFVEKLKTKLDGSAKPTRSSWRWSLVGLSVAAIALSVIVVIVRPSTPPFSTPVARITEVNGAVQWTGDGGHVEADALVGRPISGGRLESLSVDSWTVLEYTDGSKITLAGRSQLTVVDGPQKVVRLGQGRFSASVARQEVGKPMVIHTPTAKLEVLGTQLNVDADSSASRVSVNQGRVRVTRLVDGSVTEVTADHQTVVSVDRHAEFKPVRRPEPVRVWRSRFPNQVNYGQWQVAPDGVGSVRAKSLLLTCAKPNPLLIFVSSAAVVSENSSPLVLSSGGRFTIRGRLDSTAEVFFGMTMNHPKGGFAGKYFAVRKIDLAELGMEPFEWTVPFDELKPVEGAFPATPIELEIVECWCLTVHEDRGLSVQSIELHSVK